jgi:Family of unknown function (DUF5995)
VGSSEPTPGRHQQGAIVGIDQGAVQQVHRVAARLADYLTAYDEARDPRAVFAYTYLRLTTSLKESLERGIPEFTSPCWVAQLAESLAGEYFSAMNAIDKWLATGDPDDKAEVAAADQPEEIPQPWRDVYAATANGKSYVIEDVVFGMMAHISYDLPMALRRMADGADLHSHIADYHTMNAVLGAAIDGIQQEVAARYCRRLADLDRIFARHDELLSNYGIRVSRGVAWYNFQRLVDPEAGAEAVRSIERSTGAFIQQLRHPDDWRLRLALGISRRLVPTRRQWPAAARPS